MDFGQVETEFGRLKTRYEAGDLAEADLKAQLESLMVEDRLGRWWTKGYETGRWYYHDGEEWVPGDPPVSEFEPQDLTSRLPLLLTAGGWAAGAAFAGILLLFLSPAISWTLGGAVAGVGIGLALRRTRSAMGLREMSVVALGWALAGATLGGINGSYPALGFPFVALVYDLGVTWALGGLLTGLALRYMQPEFSWRQIVIVCIGWAIGGAVTLNLGGDLAAALGNAEGRYWWHGQHWVLPTLRWAYVVGGLIAGALGGAIGGWVMLWQLGAERRS